MPPTEYSADALGENVTRRLARALRAVFPHDNVPDGPYERSAEAILSSVSASPHQTAVIVEGLRGLDGLTGGDLTAVTADELSAVLLQIERTEFFQIMLTNTVVTLYSDQEVWDALGYEGFSSDKGGYVSRGFDDLDWLPEPRVEEYDGEPLTDYVPSIPGGTQPSFETKKTGAAR
ncbi:MAG: hypothetical protein PF501_19785 [Salinisphaera sp.]|jgi:hypothetical protein|nr:hypothetical protein [Salinisphaera sp.]